MNLYHFSLPGDLNVRISLSRDTLGMREAQALLEAYVPGLHFLEQPPDQIHLNVRFTESETCQMGYGPGHIWLRGPWNSNSLLELSHLLYSACRIMWHEFDLYPVHAACLGNDDYSLIVGHSGSGKTSIVRKIMVVDDAKLFSNNKTLVSFKEDASLHAIAGTRIITMRAEDLERHPLAAKTIEYEGRYAFWLKDESYAPTTSVRIRKILITRLNDGHEECNQLSKASALHTLYPYFLDTVNADTVLFDGHTVYPGTPPAGAQKHLAQQLRKVLQEIPVYTVIGSLDHITDKVLSL